MFFRSGLEELSYEANWKAFALKCVTWTKLGFTDKMHRLAILENHGKLKRWKLLLKTFWKPCPPRLDLRIGLIPRLYAQSIPTVRHSVLKALRMLSGAFWHSQSSRYYHHCCLYYFVIIHSILLTSHALSPRQNSQELSAQLEYVHSHSLKQEASGSCSGVPCCVNVKQLSRYAFGWSQHRYETV